MNTTEVSASYAKLRDGSWGIRVQGNVTPGSTVTVTTRAGERKTETVQRVIWSGNGVAICSVMQRTRPQAVRSSYSAPTWRGNGCSECRRRGDWCPRCAFDEFDN